VNDLYINHHFSLQYISIVHFWLLSLLFVVRRTVCRMVSFLFIVHDEKSFYLPVSVHIYFTSKSLHWFPYCYSYKNHFKFYCYQKFTSRIRPSKTLISNLRSLDLNNLRSNDFKSIDAYYKVSNKNRLCLFLVLPLSVF
jgi:hypothetical protein